jgi:antitoxin component HigA of HigAB toxin-antitoxin module
MIKMTFEGSVEDMIAFVSELPDSLKKRTTVKLECESFVSLDQRAYEAAKPFIETNQKINAIKAVREINGMGLKDAKDFVESKFPSTVVRHEQ